MRILPPKNVPFPEVLQRQVCFQILLIEPRMKSASGDGADIHQQCDAVGLQELNEVLERARGMAASENHE